MWRILLNYLPLDATQWDDTLRSNHESYFIYKEELITKPTLNFKQEEEKKAAAAGTGGGIRVIGKIDHPLSNK